MLDQSKQVLAIKHSAVPILKKVNQSQESQQLSVNHLFNMTLRLLIIKRGLIQWSDKEGIAYLV